MQSDVTKPERGPCCPLQRGWGRLIWVMLIGAIVYLQWPMLKGMYYNVTNAQARPPQDGH